MQEVSAKKDQGARRGATRSGKRGTRPQTQPGTTRAARRGLHAPCTSPSELANRDEVVTSIAQTLREIALERGGRGEDATRRDRRRGRRREASSRGNPLLHEARFALKSDKATRVSGVSAHRSRRFVQDSYKSVGLFDPRDKGPHHFEFGHASMGTSQQQNEIN